MKDVADLKVKQFRIFPVDRMPFAFLRSGLGQRAISAQFQMAETTLEPTTGDLLFLSGGYKPEDSDPVAIESLQINDRRIIIHAVGDSAAASRVFDAVRKFIMRIDPKDSTRWKDAEPFVFTEETTCVATLDIEPSRLFAHTLAPFIKDQVLPAAGTRGGEAELVGVRASFRLGYRMVDDSLRARSAVFAEKEFLIESRIATPLEERRFFTSSPTPSAVHLELLARLELAFKANPLRD